MKRFALIAAFALASCATPAPRDAFAFDALIADPAAYVAQRYRDGELPSALIADLTADGFECQHSAAGSECSRTRHAYASCWNIDTVRISATAPVQATNPIRCMGVTP